MSAMMLNSGYFTGSHMIMNGLISMGAATARVGCLPANRIVLVGVDLPQGDALVGVHLFGDQLEIGRRPAGTHLQLDPGPGRWRPAARAPACSWCPPSGWGEHVVVDAVLGLREPVGLDHDRVGADPFRSSPPCAGARPGPAGPSQMARRRRSCSRRRPGRPPAGRSWRGEVWTCAPPSRSYVSSPPADSCQPPTTRRARKPKNQNTTIPSSDDRMIAPTICSDCNRDW